MYRNDCYGHRPDVTGHISLKAEINLQWLAWTEAVSADGKRLDKVTKPLEINEAEPEPVLVSIRRERQQ